MKSLTRKTLTQKMLTQKMLLGIGNAAEPKLSQFLNHVQSLLPIRTFFILESSVRIGVN